jgi:hypothetical protein
LLCRSWHLSPSQRRTSQIPPTSPCGRIWSPSTVARQRLGKEIPAAKHIGNNRKIVGCVIFMRFFLFKWESVGLSVYPPLLLGNNEVKMFPLQRRIVGGVFFYAIHTLSKETGRLVLPRTSRNVILLLSCPMRSIFLRKF